MAGLATERRLIGLAFVRIVASLVALVYLLGQWPTRHLIWGPDGSYPTWLFERELPFMPAPSVLAVSSPVVFEALYHLTIAVTICHLIGWGSFPIRLAFAILVWSLLRRHPYVMTGGDSLLLLAVPWLLLTNTGAYLSADSGWRGIGAGWRPSARPWRALLHNVGVFGLLWQLSVMYLFAGLYKLYGAPWLDGSAAGAVLRIDRFSLPGVSELVYGSPLLSAVLTYWTTAFELTAPLLLWLPATRWLVAVQSVLFHGGIGVTMGLVTFAFEATMLQFVVFPDTSYRRLSARLSARLATLVRYRPRFE
ncbi:MAG: HTTM domain-containing protein [Chloroflexota bacterium]